MKSRFAFLALVLGGFVLLMPPARAEERPRVNVILWFDTEDYLLPADDDACKRLAQMLTQRHIRATFKMVGEKARVLEKRGRRDVIESLQNHDIGYHANFHSVHPTPAEYLADCGLLDGIAEFVRREGGGAQDVRRIFSVKTLACYGQPGSSWAAQAIAALPAIGVAPHGVPCYVDEGDHIGLDQKPFWYANALNVYHLGQNFTRMELHDPAAVEPAKRRFSEIVQRLLQKDEGGLISIFYHPCEWVHAQFWDSVNFRRGANPPREQWRPPPQRTPEETEGAFRRFGEYVDYIRAIPEVHFVTASDLPDLYPDRVRSIGAPQQDLAAIASGLASGIANEIDDRVMDDRAYSVADQFELLTLVLGQLLDGHKVSWPLPAPGLLGPDVSPPSTKLVQVDGLAFRDAVRDVLNFIQTEHRVPSRVFIGANAVAPADFLVALASAYDHYNKTGKLPAAEGIRLGGGVELLPARHVAQDTPELFGGWIIHREGFRAPGILEVARLQAWTLKPAIPRH